MYRYFFTLLFIFISISPLLADEPKLAGALQDWSEEDLFNIPCPASMSFSIPVKNKDSATLVGADGRVEALNFELSLYRVGFKNKEAGKCFYSVSTKELILKKSSGELVKVVDKDISSDELATAFRKGDSAGEQVVGLRVPLPQNIYLSFAEIPLEVVYGVKTNEEGGVEYLLKSKRFRASSKVVKKIIGFDPKTRQPKVSSVNYGEITLEVSIKD